MAHWAPDLYCFNCDSIIPNPEDAIGKLGFCSENCEAFDKLMDAASILKLGEAIGLIVPKKEEKE